jgi:hypothetical protein
MSEKLEIPDSSPVEKRKHLEILRKMTPEMRLQKVFELNAEAETLFRRGLRIRFPEKSDEELQLLYLRRLEKCHNSSY